MSLRDEDDQHLFSLLRNTFELKNQLHHINHLSIDNKLVLIEKERGKAIKPRDLMFSERLEGPPHLLDRHRTN